MTMNWNPSYSYATLPPEEKNIPPYWVVLTTKVPEEQGLPHFSEVHIWNIKAVGAKTAFNVSAYPTATLNDFRIDHLDIEAATAGTIANEPNATYAADRIERTVSTSNQPEHAVISGVWELPFGRGRRFGGSAPSAVDSIIGGWQVAGQLVVESGRMMTVFSGNNTFTNVVQTPSNCSGCTSDLGSVHEEAGIVWYFTPEERAKFSNPDPGQFGNTGRNAFRGPMFENLNVTASKRTCFVAGVAASAAAVFVAAWSPRIWSRPIGVPNSWWRTGHAIGAEARRHRD